MQNLVDFNYINKKDKELVKLFISSSKVKKYILGINKFTKSVQKHLQIDGICDDFTRVQKSRKKEILQIKDLQKNSIILWTSMGSPLEVKNTLDAMGFKNISYLALCKYSNFDLPSSPFMADFKDDFKKNYKKYNEIYNLLEDKKSKEVFSKVLNFKISKDYDFMQGFTNNQKEQYFDKELIPNIKNICFLDGGAYVGDTLPQIIKNFPDYKKIYAIEPNNLHINIAKRDFASQRDIEFINCGLGDKKILSDAKEKNQNNCEHNFQASSVDAIDNLIKDKVDFIKLDIEGAEQEAIKGAKNTIQKYKPILAVCIYHKAEDWYKIPQIVLSINKEYKVYIRHYMEGVYETVMYFIP